MLKITSACEYYTHITTKKYVEMNDILKNVSYDPVDNF